MKPPGTALPLCRPRTPLLLLLYALSVPERCLRTAIGWSGRLGLLLTAILPRALRNSRFFRVAVHKQLRLLSEGIGGAEAPVAPDGAAAERVESDDLPRKIIGGTLDNLAILTMHFSPVWVLLALSDVIKGASAVTEELLEELKREGIVPKGSKIDNLDELLDALSSLPGGVAEAIDRPPLSVKKLKESVEAIRADARKVDMSTLVDTEDLKGLLTSLRATSKRENRSLLQTSTQVGILAVTRAGALTRDVSLTALAGARVGGRILFRELVQNYVDSAREIRKKGLFASLYLNLGPQSRATALAFDDRRLTWTEIALSLGRLRKAPWRR